MKRNILLLRHMLPDAWHSGMSYFTNTTFLGSFAAFATSIVMCSKLLLNWCSLNLSITVVSNIWHEGQNLAHLAFLSGPWSVADFVKI